MHCNYHALCFTSMSFQTLWYAFESICCLQAKKPIFFWFISQVLYIQVHKYDDHQDLNWQGGLLEPKQIEFQTI
jgi:hypothetical protein